VFASEGKKANFKFDGREPTSYMLLGKPICSENFVFNFIYLFFILKALN